MFEGDLDNAFGNRFVAKEEIPEEGAVALAGKKTQETLTATDSIIEALDLADIELKRIAEHEVFLILSFQIHCKVFIFPNFYAVYYDEGHILNSPPLPLILTVYITK